MSQELLAKLLEDDSLLKDKTSHFDYACRCRRRALIVIAPYLLSKDLFAKALETAMKLDREEDRATVLKILIPKLPENQLSRARQIIDSIQNSRERTKTLFVLAIRCSNLLIEVLQAVFSLSSTEGQTEQLVELFPYLQQIPPTHLFSFWTSSLASLLPYSRSDIFIKADVLTPIAH